jgi:hypothetical protein
LAKAKNVNMLNTIARRGMFLAAGACALAAPATAHSTSCDTNSVQYPVDGTAAAPTDTLLWGYTQSSESVVSRLLGPAGEVAVEERYMVVEWIGEQRLGIPVLVPGAKLEADTRYTIETWYDGGSSPDSTERFTFTTGSGPLAEAPSAPELIASEPGMSAGYFVSPARWVSFEFAPHSGILIGGERPFGRDGAPDPATSVDGWLIERSQLDAALESASAVSWLTGSNVLSMGVSDCLLWPKYAADRIDARFGVLDVAGHFSGWVEMPVEIPSFEETRATLDADAAAAEARAFSAPQSGSCSLARRGDSGAASTSFAIGLLALSVLRARAKRR